MTVIVGEGYAAITAMKVGAVIVVVIALQSSVIAPLSFGDARGDIVLLVAIAAGLESDAVRGALVGFAAGLTFDLLLVSPVGLSALTYCLVGYVVGTFQGSVLRNTWWIPPLATVAASAVGVVLFAALDQVLGQATVAADRLPGIVAVVAIINGLLSRPFRWALRWALSVPATRSDRLFPRS